MATAAQTAANQANARHSTGPRTPEGKARVTRNACRHGLTARHLVIRDDERQHFEELRDSLLEELDPQGAAENVTFNDLLHAAWNLERFRRLEAESSTGTASDLSDSQRAEFFDRLGRYQARAQRAWYRALRELRTLQTNRTLRAVKLDEEFEPDVPAIADINELTKQTHSEVLSEGIKQAIRLTELDGSLLLLKAARGRAPMMALDAPQFEEQEFVDPEVEAPQDQAAL
jgi:hypothetical protein